MAAMDMPAGIRQSAASVMMVRPAAFARNEVTRPTNFFQSDAAASDPDVVSRTAVAEFNAVVASLVARGIDVQLFEGRAASALPDEVFANNWISTHADGTVVLYPLLAWNRRDERRRDIVDDLQQGAGAFRIERIVDLSSLENRGHFLEGTGSVVLDRRGRIAFACRSPRTHAEALHVFTKRLEFQPIFFEAGDSSGRPVYHTNVMLSLGEAFAVVCLAAIPDAKERYRVLRRLEEGGREVIDITLEQMRAFAANILELEGRDGKVVVMSAGAARSLRPDQLAAIGGHGEIVTVNVGTIEKFGGGSVRCMLTEIFLQRK